MPSSNGYRKEWKRVGKSMKCSMKIKTLFSYFKFKESELEIYKENGKRNVYAAICKESIQLHTL